MAAAAAATIPRVLACPIFVSIPIPSGQNCDVCRKSEDANAKAGVAINAPPQARQSASQTQRLMRQWQHSDSGRNEHLGKARQRLHAGVLRIHRRLSLAAVLFWLAQALSGVLIVFHWEVEDALIAAVHRNTDPPAIESRLGELPGRLAVAATGFWLLTIFMLGLTLWVRRRGAR
ncbi:hypothetical protein [Sphingosinicella soli]|uniref:Uncharacterized protein n=1 Tax=Sphingosinicella soli TaxID=333708 RepID=A0A7W7B0K9_9SPHN|nr:hypothetical protein [Sphingosinicella soli]MBB4630843.1 hypothetical protein [Sphingosinicella soli]